MNQKITPDKFIGSNFHIKLIDDRILEGILTVIDPFGNLLISNCYETSIDKFNSKNLHIREIGLVSVPKETIVNIKIDKKTYKNIFG
ncbi:uncharacterized protein KGF55_002227 [Candida pseudojiufengensis]|uniref:uncharacterized protein n=1 Tax=Candida pseudojiufengensis TaxID=497109 RepID=UPI002223EF62|nr:uncharacterized protein KGF55_002227 [Candida pseudojiufengensis]KAI5964285.1 hypothetical protein KGF55_002227 [Candida pseudojiufengensis]